ncbi:MAG: hypothetical protein K2P59_05435 [Acetatifactor sp.]|nr:hypothetical protein [Acetatifactor sp.]
MRETCKSGFNLTALYFVHRLEEVKTSESYQSNVGCMNEMMQRFAAESEQLRTNMNDIKMALTDVKTAVSESALGVTSVTETSVGLAGDVSDIGEEAGFNLELVGRLNQEVGKFKL